MNKVKSTLLFLLSTFVYLCVLFLPMYFIPKAVNWLLLLFTVTESKRSMIATLIVAAIFFVASSDKMYIHLHEKYNYWISRAKNNIVKALVVALISANDVLVAIPKRTILFGAYLVYSILDKLGYTNLDVDTVFVGVFIIGIDRITKSWKDEKKKLSALGRKAYSEENNITDSVIG